MKRTNAFILFFVIVSMSFAQNSISEVEIYVCPPCGSHCDDLEFEKPGVCQHCNMALVKKDAIKTIAFYLQDGVEVLDFAGPLEVFSYAGYQVFTVSKTTDPITSQGVLNIIPDYSIKDAPSADILAFFGGNSSSASTDKQVIDWVKTQEDIQYHFSVCTGAFILAEAGVLKGKTATTFHNALNSLQKNYPNTDVRFNARFVDNGNVITTAGISAGIDGALHLVAKLQGLNAAKRTAYYMEYDNWVPGDGLILSKDNPYQIEPVDLKVFTGVYEFKEGAEIELLLTNGDLRARIDGVFYPIYHEKDDFFTDANGESIYFEKDNNERVLGYRLEENGVLFKKLE